MKTLAVVQHTSAVYLGLIEDQLEGRRIRFRYARLFTAGGRLPGNVLARDWHGRPALFQVGDRALGFTGHPGTKPAIVEDLIMEFEDALVSTMTGIMRVLGLMD